MCAANAATKSGDAVSALLIMLGGISLVKAAESGVVRE